jgi:glycosyltransferase involved in cell wall biosynthesis
MPQYTDIQISVVVPTFERKQALADCLHALAAQIGVPGAYEVIVVNDGGAVEPLDEVTREFESRLDLRIVSQPNSGPAAARNFGAELAKWLAARRKMKRAETSTRLPAR